MRSGLSHSCWPGADWLLSSCWRQREAPLLYLGVSLCSCAAGSVERPPLLTSQGERAFFFCFHEGVGEEKEKVFGWFSGRREELWRRGRYRKGPFAQGRIRRVSFLRDIPDFSYVLCRHVCSKRKIGLELPQLFLLLPPYILLSPSLPLSRSRPPPPPPPPLQINNHVTGGCYDVGSRREGHGGRKKLFTGSPPPEEQSVVAVALLVRRLVLILRRRGCRHFFISERDILSPSDDPRSLSVVCFPLIQQVASSCDLFTQRFVAHRQTLFWRAAEIYFLTKLSCQWKYFIC